MSATDDPATYVYALVRAPEAPPLEAAPPGLAEAGRPRALSIDPGLWLVVADAPHASYSRDVIERGLEDLEWVSGRAIEHEAVVEHLLAHGTVVPMKLFTLFLGDQRAVADLRERRTELAALLDVLEGKREWGLRVLVDPARAAQAARSDAAEAEDEGASAGRAFLLRKRRELDASRNLRSELAGIVDDLRRELAGLAANTRVRPPAADVGRLLLDASFLVTDEGARAFHDVVTGRTEELAQRGLEVVLSGPWPAYNFVEGES